MGNKIKEYREKLGVTQEQLSEDSGVSRSIISGLESGTIKNTTVSTLTSIASALHSSITDIFFADDV